MKIVILGSVALSIPPIGHGGTEWMAYYQAKGLADQGHQITLLAARGSKKISNVKLIEVGGGGVVAGKKSEVKIDFSKMESSRKLRLEMTYLGEAMEKLIKHQDEYDLILNNMRGEAVFLPLAKMLKKPFVNVMHLPIFPELAKLFKQYGTSIITIAEHQKRNYPHLNYLATVNNCVDTTKYSFNSNPKDYLLIMSTIGRHKNQKDAIKAAKILGEKLIIAGKIRDQDYFEQEIKPHLDGEQIKHIGEIKNFEEKVRLYQEARAFLFPILWQEPFGLVMIEAMSCGTPVIGYNNGAVPEVIRDGVTGYIIKTKNAMPAGRQEKLKMKNLIIKKRGVDGLVEGVREIKKLEIEKLREMRRNCRRHVEENFSIKKMVDGYEKACSKALR